MRRSLRALLMVVGGIVGAWAGYWLGYAFGWSTGAIWPWQIGGGTGAILLSIGLAVVGVLAVGAAIALPPYLRERRLRSGTTDVDTVDATVLQGWSLGLQANGIHVHRQLYGFLVEMRLSDGTTRIEHATQWLTHDEFDALVSGSPAHALVDRDHPGRVIVVAAERASAAT